VLRATLDSVDIRAVKQLQERLADARAEVAQVTDSMTAAEHRAAEAQNKLTEALSRAAQAETRATQAEARAVQAEQNSATLEAAIGSTSTIMTNLTELQERAQQQLTDYEQQLSEQGEMCELLMEKLKRTEEDAAASVETVAALRAELASIKAGGRSPPVRVL
jgi:chromosome segregation ATPase